MDIAIGILIIVIIFTLLGLIAGALASRQADQTTPVELAWWIDRTQR
jgi:hypothetical protein